MKILKEFSNRGRAADLVSSIQEIAARLSPQKVNLMEVCGTHTAAIMKSGIRSLLPENVRLLSGPGCPVCVTPPYLIDYAVQLAKLPNVILTTFGDMMRVPATEGSLEDAKGRGASVSVVYSPMEPLEIAKGNPCKQVIFFSIGFETTAPAIAWTIARADRDGLTNFSIIPATKLLPPVLAELASAPDIAIDGFLCPGHVSVVTGSSAYTNVVQRGIPCTIAGFEPLDILLAVHMLLRQISEGRAEVEIEYSRAVSARGNQKAQAIVDTVFEPADSAWRGLGTIKKSGQKLRKRYTRFDALAALEVEPTKDDSVRSGCICGDILKGIRLPTQCTLFGKKCTPEKPVGPCIVSSEGTCAVYYAFGGSLD